MDMEHVMGLPVESRFYEAKAKFLFGYPADSRWSVRIHYPKVVFVRYDGKTIGSAAVTHDEFFGPKSQELTFALKLEYHDTARIDIEEQTLCVKPQFSLIASVPPAPDATGTVQQIGYAGVSDGLVVYELMGVVDLVRIAREISCDGVVYLDD